MKAERIVGALLISLILALPPAALAHGDDDHGKKKAVAAGPGMIARTARTGDYEVMLKHPVLEPLHAHAARLFITRYATNEPVKDVAVSLVIAGKGAAPITVTAKPSTRPGEYEVSLPSLDQGSYNLSATVAVGEVNGTVSYGAVAVEESRPPAESGGAANVMGALLWLFGLMVLGLASVTGFIAWHRRAVLQPAG